MLAAFNAARHCSCTRMSCVPELIAPIGGRLDSDATDIRCLNIVDVSAAHSDLTTLARGGLGAGHVSREAASLLAPTALPGND